MRIPLLGNHHPVDSEPELGAKDDGMESCDFSLG
jgi:hypothetical protein